jgi:choline dehydrogenase
VWTWAATHEPAPVGAAAFQTVMLLATGAEPDLHVLPRSASGDGAVLGLASSVMRPVSRGSVRLGGADPQAPPRIDPAFLVEEDDVRRAVRGVELCRELLRTGPLADLVTAEIAPGEADLRDYVRTDVTTYFHPAGTCRMGPPSDPDAVVDVRGRVRGVEGLSVVDASVLPTIPSANTNLPVMAVAERLVQLRQAAPGAAVGSA